MLKHSSDNKAFTLIELLVVMVIIVIAFYALRPGIVGALRGAENRKALRQLVGLLTSARTEAVASGRLVRVVCDADAGLLWAEVQPDPALDRAYFEPLSVPGEDRVRLPDSLRLSDLIIGGREALRPSDEPIYFYPDGRTDGAAVLLSDANGRELAVEIAPATGKVSVSA